MRLHNKKQLYDYRKKLRNNLTFMEARVWYYLKDSKIGAKFRRQHSIGPFIVDFYCPKYKLVIELDGSPHDNERAFEYDQKRSNYLQHKGLRVVRFVNSDVQENIEGVIFVISSYLSPPRLPTSSESTPPHK